MNWVVGLFIVCIAIWYLLRRCSKSRWSSRQGSLRGVSETEAIQLCPKTTVGPDSSIKKFPLLYLYFDDFGEILEARGEATCRDSTP